MVVRCAEFTVQFASSSSTCRGWQESMKPCTCRNKSDRDDGFVVGGQSAEGTGAWDSRADGWRPGKTPNMESGDVEALFGAL